MAVSLELVEMLRERARVSYEEARAALEKCEGDIVEALVYLEQQGKIKPPQTATICMYGFGEKLKQWFKACNETKLVVSKNDRIMMDLSLTVVIIVTVFIPPLTVIGLLVALFTGHKIRFERPGSTDMQINKTFDEMSSAATKISEQVASSVSKS
ncbi:MAG: DUF4342 domain-containing protein [Syntrophomonadaceae bacterium]|nr:DUF4342 domain-containing protein [Syntrophomonadaceae bacterium]